MQGFLKIGKRWFNVDAIHYVEVMHSSQLGPVCMIHFADKGTLSVEGEQSQELQDWLAANAWEPCGDEMVEP